MAARRTTHRSRGWKKLYAKRNRAGKFTDIQSFKRAHRQDLKRTSIEELAAKLKRRKLSVESLELGILAFLILMRESGNTPAMCKLSGLMRRMFAVADRWAFEMSEGVTYVPITVLDGANGKS